MIILINCKTVFEVINKMVRSVNLRIEGILNTEHMKHMDLFDGRINISYDDIV